MKKLLLVVLVLALLGGRRGDLVKSSADRTDALIRAQSPTLYLDPDSPVELEPLVHYTMEDNAASTAVTDKSGNYAGTAFRNTSLFTTASGKITRALNFDGVDDNITAGADVFGTGAVSVCMWASPTGAGDSLYPRLFDNGQTLCLRENSTGKVRCSRNDSTYTESAAGVLADAGGFKHVCFTSPGSTGTIYINGAVSGTPGSVGAPGAPLTNSIFGNTNARARSFTGVLDDIRVYNYELTPNQVQAIYNSGTGHQNQSTSNTQGAVVVDSANRVGAWQSRVGGIEFVQSTDGSKPYLTRGDGLENVLSYSELLSSWTLNRISAPTQVADPDGGSTAWRLLADANNNTHQVVNTLNVPFISGQALNVKLWVKAVAGGQIQIRFANAGVTVNNSVNIDLTNGTVQSNPATTGATRGVLTATAASGGYWLSFTMTPSVTASDVQFQFYILTAAFGSSFIGAGEGLDVYRPSVSTNNGYIRTPGNYPIFSGLNGRRVVRFDGVDDTLVSTTAASSVMSVNAKTLGAVTQHIIDGTGDILRTTGGQSTLAYYNSGATHQPYIGNTDAGGAALAINSETTTNPAVIVGLHNGTSIHTRVNTDDSAWLASGNTTSLAGALVLGSSGAATRYLSGKAGPIFAYNKVLAGTVLDPIERGLAEKYGVSLAGATSEQSCENYIRSLTPTLWLDSSDLSTITKDGSNKVSAWASRMASPAISFTQAGADAIKPVWTGYGMSFTAASGQYMTSTSTLDDLFNNNAKTVFAVWYRNTIGTNNDNIINALNNRWGLQISSGNVAYHRNDDGAADNATFGGVVVGQHLWEGTHDGVNVTLTNYGATSATNSAASGNTSLMTDTLVLGNNAALTQPLEGKLLTLITDDSVWTADQRARVRSCLGQRYGISF